MNESLSERLLARWPLIAIGGGLLLMVVILYGCDTRQRLVIHRHSGGSSQGSCATQLESGLDQVRPGSLGLVGIDATLRVPPGDAAKTLSQWLRQPACRDAVPAEPVSAEGKRLLTRLLGAEEAAAVDSDRFTPFDAAHVRDAMLDFQTAQRLARDGANDLDRAMRVFDYVVRTVSLVGEGAVAVPQSAYEAHLFGRGSAEERALLFVNLLRQLRIDAVVLRPAGDGGPWWVGVLLDDGTYLFDPELGLPVPAADSAPAAPSFLPKPATWTQAAANPDLLIAARREAGLAAEPIAAERLKSPRVELVGPGSFWRTAMERLELSLSADRGALLYDPLHDTKAGQGLFGRVADSGRSDWTEEAIGVWAHPRRTEELREDLSSADRQRLEQRATPYLGPVELNTKSGAMERGKALWETRLDHMSGHAEGSIVRYQQVRLAGSGGEGLSPNDDVLNRQAADEAYYWTAHAQFDSGRYETAAAAARGYLERGGDHADEATALLALALAADGKTAEAAAEVAKLPEGAPAARLRWLVARWKPAAE